MDLIPICLVIMVCCFGLITFLEGTQSDQSTNVLTTNSSIVKMLCQRHEVIFQNGTRDVCEQYQMTTLIFGMGEVYHKLVSCDSGYEYPQVFGLIVNESIYDYKGCGE